MFLGKPTFGVKYPKTVAFYDYVNVALTNIGTDLLVFDIPVSNYGNCYSKHTGICTAAQGGVYVSSLIIFLGRGSYVAVNIYKNSEVVWQLYRDMTTSHAFSSSSMVPVIYMSIGVATYFRTSSITTSAGSVYSDSNVKSSFAGWKIADLV